MRWTGIEAERRINWTKTDRTGQERDNSQISPRRLWSNKRKSQDGDPANDTKDTIENTLIYFHFSLPDSQFVCHRILQGIVIVM
jgi:hypothetical protein